MNQCKSEFGRNEADHIPTWIDTNEVSLHYRLESRGETNVSIVLIHELGGSIASWDAIAAALVPRADVLRYDQRGQGLSEKVRSGYPISQHVDDLCALLDRVPIAEPCWLVSAAAGAAIAVLFTARFPQRVAGIVMCGPALDADSARRSLLEQRSDLAVRQGMRAIVETTLARSWPPTLRTDTRSFERYRARLLSADPVGYAFANRALSEMDLSPVLEHVQCPCLLLAGSHDLLRPPELIERQMDQFRHAEYRIVTAGHLMAIQNPDDVAAHIEAFIASASPLRRVAELSRPT